MRLLEGRCGLRRILTGDAKRDESRRVMQNERPCLMGDENYDAMLDGQCKS
ncbi:hypothetical protein F2Q68_00029677 [Brassica cretica]|uniref:Uncharacterized protein n=1 Tax=Brassica cretica TaxID=69181 RepID=A0A8S9N7Y8_BRACR|nr:hypothetical protein F2Q68_00029677 [Brassica cretica]KAF3499845.1 hypothetical protein F2Q69_00041937 [Brassica cretica]